MFIGEIPSPGKLRSPYGEEQLHYMAKERTAEFELQALGALMVSAPAAAELACARSRDKGRAIGLFESGWSAGRHGDGMSFINGTQHRLAHLGSQMPR